MTLLSSLVPNAQSVDHSCSAGFGQNLSGMPLNSCPARFAAAAMAIRRIVASGKSFILPPAGGSGDAAEVVTWLPS